MYGVKGMLETASFGLRACMMLPKFCCLAPPSLSLFLSLSLFKVQDNLEDQMSKLPEDILVSVLSQLKLREAARTSVLSRRWRNMWKYTTGTLDFDNSVLMHDMKHSNKQNYSILTERDRFIAWVNLVLELHQSSTLDEFKVCFDLDRRNVVNSWICIALKKRVKRLELDFRRMWPSTDLSYILTHQILCSSRLDSLKALRLSFIEVTGEVLEYVLSSCPFLEVLHVEHSRSLVVLKVPSSLPKLKCLEIMYCHSMEYLEVLSDNIVSFSYHGPKIHLFFERFPCLVEGSFGDDFSHFLVSNIHKLTNYINQLESLALSFKWWMTSVCPDLDLATLADWNSASCLKFHGFRKLKQLKLSVVAHDVDFCVRQCTRLLEASPSLHRFVVQMRFTRIFEGGYLRKAKFRQKAKCRQKAKLPHRFLKAIEFLAFDGSACHVELVLQIVERVESLEKIIVVPAPLRSQDVKEAVVAARGLENSLRPGLQLVITDHKDIGHYRSIFEVSKMCY